MTTLRTDAAFTGRDDHRRRAGPGRVDTRGAAISEAARLTAIHIDVIQSPSGGAERVRMTYEWVDPATNWSHASATEAFEAGCVFDARGRLRVVRLDYPEGGAPPAEGDGTG